MIQNSGVVAATDAELEEAERLARAHSQVSSVRVFRLLARIHADAERFDKTVSDSHEFLSNGKNEIFELLVSVREKFDGSEYQQGKKDGLRTALALLGMPEMQGYNRGEARAAAPTGINHDRKNISGS